jgi:hypothetical protein
MELEWVKNELTLNTHAETNQRTVAHFKEQHPSVMIITTSSQGTRGKIDALGHLQSVLRKMNCHNQALSVCA